MYLALIGYAGINIMMMKMIEQVRLNKCEILFTAGNVCNCTISWTFSWSSPFK